MRGEVAETTSVPSWVATLQTLWPLFGTAFLAAVGFVGKWWMGRVESREQRARDDMLAATERQRQDHEGDLDRLSRRYDEQIAAEREQHQREIERLSAAFEAHYLTLRDIPIRQDKIVQEAVEMAQRLASAVPVASGAPRRRAAP